MELNLITILLALLIVVGVIVLIALVRTLSHVNELTDSLSRTSNEAAKTMAELRDAALPIVNKAEVTIDAVNAEMLRVDGIITSLEQTTERVAEASDTVSGLVNAPVEIVSGVTDRVLSMWRQKKADHKAHQLEEKAASAPAQAPNSAPAGEAVSTAASAKSKKKTSYCQVKD